MDTKLETGKVSGGRVLGCGVGLRSQHYPVITTEWPPMDWFEAISENYMDTGGRPLKILDRVSSRYPLALHGTSLSIGSVDPLNLDYLARLKKLVHRVDPFVVSDHLCWSGFESEHLHDLLPLPLTGEALQHVITRIDGVQNFLGRRMLIENVSTYVTYRHSTMPEWEFLTKVARRSGCGILLDLNNIYVNATNHRFDPAEYVKNIPGELVGQFHLAGHTDKGTFLFDTHSSQVIEAVWDLYRLALGLWGPIPTLIEWDEDIPPFSRLSEEAGKAREIAKAAGRVVQHSHVAVSAFSLPARDRLPPAADPISLPNLQKEMKSMIQPQARPEGKDVAFKSFLNPQGGVPGEEHIRVYTDGYLARILESLGEVFETVHAVAGPDLFSVAACEYARVYPSHTYNLNFVGRHFPEYLRTLPLDFQPFPFLSDLAYLEWLVWEAFHAFDEPPLALSHWGAISLEEWEGTQLVFQPSVALMASSWPVLDLWKRRRTLIGAGKQDVKPQAQHILVGRRDLQVRCEFLDATQFQLLADLLAGRSLGEACERLAEGRDAELYPIKDWFSNWVRDGLIVRCEPAPPSNVLVLLSHFDVIDRSLMVPRG